MSSTSGTVIPHFNGDKKKFPWFFNIFLDYSSRIGTEFNPLGCLGFILSANDFFRTYAEFKNCEGKYFTAVPDPGEFSEAPKEMTFEIFKFSSGRYDGQQKALSTVTVAFLTSLGPKALKTINGPAVATLTKKSLSVMVNALWIKYGKLSMADLQTNLSLLDQPFIAGEPIDDHIASHRDIHAAALLNKQPLPEFLKVTKFMSSLVLCGLFTFCMHAFTSEHPEVEDQKFDDIAERVEKFAESNTKLTTGTEHYSAAQTSTTHSNVTANKKLYTEEEFEQRVAAAVSERDKKGSTSAPRTYCHTHGPGAGHNSEPCLNKKDGHKDTATWKNKQGGATVRTHYQKK